MKDKIDPFSFLKKYVSPENWNDASKELIFLMRGFHDEIIQESLSPNLSKGE